MDHQALKPIYDQLHRYAGWLDRGRPSVTVRTDVQALGTAVDAGADPMPLLEVLNANLARLPSGELRKILRAASAKFRCALTEQQ